MPESLHFQEKLVAMLKLSIADNVSLAAELSDLLNISMDSVYRRLRCQSAFSFDEVGFIAERFGISLDGLYKKEDNQVNFNFNPMYGQPFNFSKYLEWYASYLTDLAKIPDTKVIYAAEDIPVIRHFRYPHLSAFKAYYWSKAVLNIEVFHGKQFDFSEVSQKLLDNNLKTAEAYSKLNVTEIWSEETITSTLKQISFYFDCHFFETHETALTVLSDLRKMLEQMEQECQENNNENRERAGDFKLYTSDLMIGNNCVLIEPGKQHAPERVFIGHNTFNTISTSDPKFLTETRHWINNLIRKSVLLTGSAEKQRVMFFKKMYDKITALENYIKQNSEIEVAE
jgi:hypothetical protein